MAIRRMLSKKIIDTDAFMDMPLSTQALYMHLVINADDDGFVGSPRKVMRSIGCNADDAKILEGKKFILSFESGVIVIKHWLIHNLIRHDRYVETTYLKEKQLLNKKPNKSYTLTTPSNTNVIPNGNQMAPQVSIGKDSIVEDSKEKEEKKKTARFKKPTIQELTDYKAEKKYTLDVEMFYNYYESNGWFVGKQKMKSWKAAMANWEKRDNQYNKPSNTQAEQVNDWLFKE